MTAILLLLHEDNVVKARKAINTDVIEWRCCINPKEMMSMPMAVGVVAVAMLHVRVRWDDAFFMLPAWMNMKPLSICWR